MQFIQPLKTIKYALVAACIVMPWNATAINQGSLTDQLLSKKLGRNITESLLVKTLLEITNGKTKDAFNTVNELIRTTPNFKLGYIIRGDLLAAQGHGLMGFGDTKVADLRTPATIDEITGLRDEARTRINYYLSEKKSSLLPNLFIQPNRSQENIILVDTSENTLYLYKNENGKLKYIADYYVTIGKNGVGKLSEGDKRTPLGVYFTGQKLNQPLDAIYGDAAYPLNYPNEMDQYRNKSGSGIWVHGTPTESYSRPPRASDGCLVLSNPDLKTLEPILNSGKTPILIVNNLYWLQANQIQEELKAQDIEKKNLQNAIENWRKDWASQDTASYLSHYSDKFFYSDGGYRQWSEYKREVQAKKLKVEIKIEDISMFGYPGLDQSMVVVNFEQDYKSPIFQNKMRKRQYWVNENNQWKIFYEGAG
jgi:murein L,D-transpeptidase YafK